MDIGGVYAHFAMNADVGSRASQPAFPCPLTAQEVLPAVPSPRHGLIM